MFGLFRNKLLRLDGRSLGDYSVEIAERKAREKEYVLQVFNQKMKEANTLWEKGILTIEYVRKSPDGYYDIQIGRLKQEEEDLVAGVSFALRLDRGMKGKNYINNKVLFNRFCNFIINKRGFS